MVYKNYYFTNHRFLYTTLKEVRPGEYQLLGGPDKEFIMLAIDIEGSRAHFKVTNRLQLAIYG